MENNENDDSAKIKSITSAKKKKKDHLSQPEVFQALTDVINHCDYTRRAARFESTYYVYDPAGTGVRLVLKEDSDSPGVVRVVDEQCLANELIVYTRNKMSSYPDFQLTWRVALDAVKYWRAYSDPIEEPATVLWADDPGRCWRRLPWPRISEPGPAPLFKELIDRCTNADALCLWIGSLFDVKSDLQQYVWMFGQGNDGKSALLRVLARAMGQAYRTKQPPNMKTGIDPHWTANLLGARLVAFPDCNHYGFPSTGFFKSLTGGDLQEINRKFKDPFTTKLNAKYLFLSNERPALSSEAADLRRPIFCEVRQFDGDPDGTYEERLWEQAGNFLGGCLLAYQAVCPQHGRLPVDQDQIKEWTSTLEEDFETLFEQCFELDRHGEGVKPQDLQIVVKRLGMRPRQIEFRAWLERTHQVRSKTVRNGTTVSRRYVGIKIKPICLISEQFVTGVAPMYRDRNREF